MNVHRQRVPSATAPFPVHGDAVARLLAAHPAAAAGERDPIVAHLLGTCAAYAYADLDTMTMIAARLGLDGGGCVAVAQTVDAMLVFSTAYLLQSRCGRLAILVYRGTEPATLGNWLGDADVGGERMEIGGEPFAVHAGFRRNMRATRWGVLEELRLAAQGRSLAAPDRRVEHPLEALYVTGHSLGGAMAVLFALSLLDDPAQHALLSTLRAVYTYGQPLVTGEPLPAAASPVTARLFRHVAARDVIPALPVATWGRLAHSGREYRLGAGGWQPSAQPVAQLASMREVPRVLLGYLASARRREQLEYSIAEHAPHHYLAALRPGDRLTELGDRP
jgi:lipase (class 3)